VIAVDTNVIASLVLPTSRLTTAAENLLRADRDWVAPVLWRSELTNILATGVRNGWLTLDQAHEALATAEELMAGGDYQVPASDVLRLACDSGFTGYDCEFAVLAIDLKLKLVTTDQQLLRTFPQIAVALNTFEPQDSG
jgi:predicted nucleic acid-binding protein